VGDPLSLMCDVAEQNLTMWKEMQESFLIGGLPGTGKRKRDPDKS